MAQVNLGHVVGPGVPTGGTANQVLVKNGSTNFDTSWKDARLLPAFSEETTERDAADAKLASGMAIVANGDTHTAIADGQFVYVRNHSTLAEGLYKATESIGTDVALTTSNLTADGSGGLNDLKGRIDSLNSKITNMVIEFGTSSKDLIPNLTDNWRTAVPNDSRVYFVRIDSMYGAFYGVICRYADVYGTGVVSRYDGRVYKIQMNDGSCSAYQLQNRPIQVLSTGSKTISGNGNIGYTFSHRVLVLGVYSTSSDIVCSAYPSSGADSSGSAEWWIHCRNANSSSSVASGTITCYIIYIDMA